MTERPINFNGEMVRAIIAGRKTQTRRPVKNATDSPYGIAGDRLWVCEGKYTPRDESSITLVVSDVRVELLQDITETDAQAEGVASIDEFRALWDSIYGERGLGFDANPWVWVIRFRMVEDRP